MNNSGKYTPLAERMRPKSLDKFYGQEHLVGEGKILSQLVKTDRLVSIIFWGPPGSGKTTLGYLLAHYFNCPCLFLVRSFRESRKSRRSWPKLKVIKNFTYSPRLFLSMKFTVSIKLSKLHFYHMWKREI